MMGDAEACENRAADMLRVVRAKCSPTIDRDLPAFHVKTPSYDIALMDIADPLVGTQLVYRLRQAVLGKIASGGQSYHPHVADTPRDEC